MTDIAEDQVQETVTRRRIIAAEKAAPQPAFWDYVQKLSADDWSTPGGTPLHSLYIYRDEPPPSLALAKCTTYIFPETNTPWSDQEEMEMAFLQRFGGGRYRFILKKGSERVCVHSFVLPGPYKNLTSRQDAAPNAYGNPPGAPGGNGNGYYDPTAAVAQTAIHQMANQDKQAVEIGISALAQAAQVIKNFQPAPASSVTDDLQKAFMNAMITRLTAAPPDPVETFARMSAVMRESNSGTNGGIASSVIDKVVSAVVDRGLNPPASASGPAVSMGAELVRILPSVAQYATEAMANYARIMEAQRDALAIQKGSQSGYYIPPTAPSQPRPAAPSAPSPTPPSLGPGAAAPSGANGSTGANDFMTFLERKIVEILKEPQSAEWAAEETLNFLDRMDASIVPQLISGGEKGLMDLFQAREALRPALENIPRLQEFIKWFLRYATESHPELKPN